MTQAVAAGSVPIPTLSGWKLLALATVLIVLAAPSIATPTLTTAFGPPAQAGSGGAPLADDPRPVQRTGA